jgi:hypothetical protein
MKITHVSAALIASLVVSSSGFAQAQAARTPRYIEGDWTFVADMQGHRARSVLAWHPVGTLTGSNLGVLWFVHQADETWKAWSWTSPSVGDAVCSIRALSGYADAFTDQPDLNEKALSCAPATPPVALEKGLLETDPMQPVLASLADPTALVQALASTGWQAAPGLSELMAETRAACLSVLPITDILDGVQYRTLTDLGQVTEADLSFAASVFRSARGAATPTPELQRLVPVRGRLRAALASMELGGASTSVLRARHRTPQASGASSVGRAVRMEPP